MNAQNVGHVLHYVGGGLCLLFGLLSMIGIHLPGIDVNPAVAVTSGSALLGIGLKIDS